MWREHIHGLWLCGRQLQGKTGQRKQWWRQQKQSCWWWRQEEHQQQHQPYEGRWMNRWQQGQQWWSRLLYVKPPYCLVLKQARVFCVKKLSHSWGSMFLLGVHVDHITILSKLSGWWPPVRVERLSTVWLLVWSALEAPGWKYIFTDWKVHR